VISSQQPEFLLCSPESYDAHFLFNPFMSYRERVSFRRARAQWRLLVRTLEEAGAAVKVMEPEPATSALVFTADAAFAFRPGCMLVLENDGPRGDWDAPVYRRWLAEAGFHVEGAPPGRRLDGGNLLRLPNGDVLAGLKPHASGVGERYLASLLKATSGAVLHAVPLAGEPFLHLDTVVGVLGDRGFLVHRGGLADPHALVDGPLAGAEIVEVDAEDARRFGCNVVVAGDTVITGPVSIDLRRRIGRLGFHVEALDLGEFYKAGGGAKCLTLPLWRNPKEER
jgi:N-dimethylarginine dimethylaminohydrolase